MKIFNIFQKNLKTISRNWSYFFVLVFFPLLLILSSGFVLNSLNVSNVGVMVVHGNSSMDISAFPQFSKYPTAPNLNYCLSQLKLSHTGACLQLNQDSSGQVLNVYYDGSDRLVEQYVRRIVLNEVSQAQNQIIKGTSESIKTNVQSYQDLFAKTRQKLVDTRSNLIAQRTDLEQKKAEVEQMRSQFMDIYTPLKQSEPAFNQQKNTIEQNQGQIDQSVVQLRQYTSNSFSTIQKLNNSGLGPDQVTYVNELYQYTVAVNNFLNLYDATYGSGTLVTTLDNVSQLYSELDNIKSVLDQTVVGLNDAIVSINKTIVSIDTYLVELDKQSASLSSFSQQATGKNLNWNFISGLSASDPVLLSFPLLVSIIIMFTSLILPNMITSKQTHENSYFREMVSPVSKFSFLVANYFINLFFILVQAGVLYFVGVSWVGIPPSSGVNFFVSILLAATVFIFVGMGISYRVRSRSLSSLVTIFTVMFSLILSSVVAPPILASGFVKFFMNMNPFVILLGILRNIFLAGGYSSYLKSSFLLLGVYSFVLSLLVWHFRRSHDRHVGA